MELPPKLGNPTVKRRLQAILAWTKVALPSTDLIPERIFPSNVQREYQFVNMEMPFYPSKARLSALRTQNPSACTVDTSRHFLAVRTLALKRIDRSN